MFEGEKTFVFWLGLIILALASIVLFSELWYTAITFQSDIIDYRFLVPPVIGTVVFILIGLYMMKSGTKKKEEGKTQLLTQ
jgi:putative Mn2+ efflux pump MntP